MGAVVALWWFDSSSALRLETEDQCSNCRGKVGVKPLTVFSTPWHPLKLCTRGPLCTIYIEFTSQFWLGFDHRKVQPPAKQWDSGEVTWRNVNIFVMSYILLIYCHGFSSVSSLVFIVFVFVHPVLFLFGNFCNNCLIKYILLRNGAWHIGNKINYELGETDYELYLV